MKLLITTFFIYTLFGLINGHISKSIITAPIMSVTGGCWWFMKCYLQLLIISPALNTIKSLDDKSFMKIFAILAFVNIIMGLVLKEDFNPDGFNLNHFIFIYFVGYALRRFKKRFDISNKCITLLLLMSLVISIVIGVDSINTKAYDFFYAYNNPFIILESVCIFTLFIRANFENKLINWIACSALSVYLITDESAYSRPLLVKICKNILFFNSNNIFITLAELFLLSLVIYLTCVIIDKIFNLILAAPIKLLNNMWIGLNKRQLL